MMIDIVECSLKNELLVMWHKPDSAAELMFHLTLLG